MMRSRLTGLAVLAVAVAGTILSRDALAIDPAVQPQAVVMEGDSVSGLGLVTGVYNLSVNMTGDSYVEVDTDFVDPLYDYVILSNGVTPIYGEGMSLPAPSGAAINLFDSMSLTNVGNASFVWQLRNTAGGTADDYAVFRNLSLVLQEGDPVGWAGATPGTIFTYFAECKMTDADQIMVMGYCDDPTISGTSDFMVLKVDAATGTQTLIALEGDPAPGTIETFKSFATGPENSDQNNNGDMIYQGYLTGSTANDGAIYINQTLVLREGDPSPVTGRNWLTLTSPKLSINDSGKWAVLGHLDGDSTTKRLLMVDGKKVMQEGDTHPDFAPATINYMASPIKLSNHGDILYTADWNASQESGLFVNGKLLIQSGVTTINGIVVDRVWGSVDTLAMSDDGRYILAEVLLTGSIDAAVMIDRGPWDILGGELEGSSGTPMLRGWGSLQGGSPVTFDLENAKANAPAHLILGFNQANLPFMCTLLVPTPDIVLYNLPTDSFGRLSITSPFPASVPSGFSFYAQYFVTDSSACAGYSASNAIRGTTP